MKYQFKSTPRGIGVEIDCGLRTEATIESFPNTLSSVHSPAGVPQREETCHADLAAIPMAVYARTVNEPN